jgi:glycerol-3-phosphate dehydrogenase
VVPRLFDHDRAYIFQNGDGRIVFAIPYQGDFTLIGTTDVDHAGEASDAAASAEEIAYLCAAVSDYFAKAVTPAEVVWTYAGVRPLLDDGSSKAQEATRDYLLHLDAPAGAAPLLSAFGGKITTYRRLAESALEALGPFLPAGRAPRWTSEAPLPGGDFPVEGLEALIAALGAEYPDMPPALIRRLARAYGTRSRELLGPARTLVDLGRTFLADLTEAEVRYLMQHEWAQTAEDVLWRRSKLGLRADPAGTAALAEFMASMNKSAQPGQGRDPAGTARKQVL